MKINQRHPRHWYYFWFHMGKSCAYVFLSMPFRIFRNRRKRRVVFYYQMHGNIKPLVDYIQAHDPDVELYFLAFPEYLKMYEGRHNLPSLSAVRFLDLIKVAQSDVVITNYSAHTIAFYARYTNIKFVDVGHGVHSLKKATAKVQAYLNDYAEVWVASPAQKRLFEREFNITSPVVATGYARTDRLVLNDYDRPSILKKYRLPDKKLILIAPTWQHNDQGRSIFPFGLTEIDFLTRLNNFAKRTDSFVIFRAHMLSGSAGAARKVPHIRAMPVEKYPDTEELLGVTDILISDWSSVVFDFVPTRRPTVFLDVKPPFKGEEAKKRSSTEHRFGPVVNSFDKLETTLEKYLKRPELFKRQYAKKIKATEKMAYGDKLDGRSTERCYRRLKKLLESA